QTGGTRSVQGTVTNSAAGTLPGGTWQVFANSTLRLIGGGITTNAATIILDGPNSNIYSDTGTTNALAGFTTNASGGTFTVENGRAFATAGAFTNSGKLVTGPAGQVQGTGNYTQAAAAPLMGPPRGPPPRAPLWHP